MSKDQQSSSSGSLCRNSSDSFILYCLVWSFHGMSRWIWRPCYVAFWIKTRQSDGISRISTRTHGRFAIYLRNNKNHPLQPIPKDPTSSKYPKSRCNLPLSRGLELSGTGNRINEVRDSFPSDSSLF
jgi:hypothetical protein